MYTLILIVIGLGSPGTPPSVAVTHYTVGTQAKCEEQRKLLLSQNVHNSSLLIDVRCLP